MLFFAFAKSLFSWPLSQGLFYLNYKSKCKDFIGNKIELKSKSPYLSGMSFITSKVQSFQLCPQAFVPQVQQEFHAPRYL